jgi:hypothetical protein
VAQANGASAGQGTMAALPTKTKTKESRQSSKINDK